MTERYSMKDDHTKRWRYGVIAQDVARVLTEHGIDPHTVGFFDFGETRDGMMAIAYDDLQMLLIAGMV